MKTTNKTKIVVKNRFDQKVLIEGEYENLRDALQRNQEANLRGANLWGADLLETTHREEDFREANLREADLRGADLRGANLWGANLQEADLRGANLWEADLRGAKIKITQKEELIKSLGIEIMED